MMEKDQAYIDIDIQNNGDILRCILETIPYMEGWIADPNAENFYIVNHCPRFFRFFLNEKKFSWLCGDEGPLKGGTLTLDPMVISDMAQISELLEFVNHAASQLKNPKTASEKLNEQFEKFFGSPSSKLMDTRAVAKAAEKLTKYPSLTDIIQVQPMAQPSAKVFYLDYVYGVDESKTPYPEMAKSIQKAADMVAKNNVAIITASQNAAKAKAAKLFADAAEKSKKKKLYEDMAKDVQEEIDKEIIDKMTSVVAASQKKEPMVIPQKLMDECKKELTEHFGKKIKKWESETLGSWDDGLVVDPPYGLSISPEFKEKHKEEIAKAKEYVSKLTTVQGCNKALEHLLGMHDPLNEMLRKMILGKLHDIKDSMEILAANVKVEKHPYTYTNWHTGLITAPSYPKWET